MYKTYSVLMSVYYKEKSSNLKKAIESMMKQTVKTDDFVLVCDGPLTSELESVIELYKNTYSDVFNIVRLEYNAGLGIALSIGVKICKNELIARMDSDDISNLRRCEIQLSYFNTNLSCDVVSGTVAEFEDTPDLITSYKKLPESYEKIVEYSKRRNPVNHPCAMVKKSSVLLAGNYQSFYYLEDYYLWIRMLQNKFIFHNLKEVLVYMRTDKGLYKRRSGWQYICTQMKLRNYMLRTGYISFINYIGSFFVRIVVALVPSRIRKKIYLCFLRENSM